jgi:hypothetical protein
MLIQQHLLILKHRVIRVLIQIIEMLILISNGDFCLKTKTQFLSNLYMHTFVHLIEISVN